jgi:glycosyltransferase involved in cell wall biosynthesis
MVHSSPIPAVSVLLPVRDGAATIEQAVASLLGQTLAGLEVVVVDDGSEDDTGQILERLCRTDGRLRVIRQSPAGIVAALQAATRAARAPFLARMDADDRAHPARLERQLAWLRRRPELGAVGCLVRTVSDGPVLEGWARYERWLNGCRTADQIARDLFVESPLAHPSVTMRRTAFEEVGGYRELDGPEDYDLWLRLAAAGWRLAKVPAVLLEWRDHPRRLTRTDPRYRPEAFLRLKAHHLARGPLARNPGRPVWIWGAGRYGRQLGRALEAEGIRLEAFVDIDPKKIGRRRRGRPVLAPRSLLDAPDALVLAAVPVPGARALIRGQLTRMGFVEGVDYWCCA